MSDPYLDWSQKRVDFAVSKLGESFFENKSVLELASGTGYVGDLLTKLGAHVTVADVREDNLANIEKNFPHLKRLVINQNGYWSIDSGPYDVIIHMGVLYHLEKWKEDLESTKALMHKDSVLILETEILNGSDNEFEMRLKENPGVWDQAFESTGVRITAQHLENFLKSLGFEFERYDDPELNYSIHVYDWQLNNELAGEFKAGRRRFWIAKLKGN